MYSFLHLCAQMLSWPSTQGWSLTFSCFKINNFRNVQENVLNFHPKVFLLRQLWIVSYYVKILSNNLSNENKNISVSREMILQNLLIVTFWFTFCFEDNRNISVYVFITEEYLTDFWRNNWPLIIDVVERLTFWAFFSFFFSWIVFFFFQFFAVFCSFEGEIFPCWC